jgi:hypothetical protein
LLSGGSIGVVAASESRGNTIRKTTGGLTTTQNTTFEADFQALDDALGQIDSAARNTGSPLSPEQQRVIILFIVLFWNFISSKYCFAHFVVFFSSLFTD